MLSHLPTLTLLTTPERFCISLVTFWILSLSLQSRQHDMFLEYSRIHRAKPLLLVLPRGCWVLCFGLVWFFLFLQALMQSFLTYFYHDTLIGSVLKPEQKWPHSNIHPAQGFPHSESMWRALVWCSPITIPVSVIDTKLSSKSTHFHKNYS